jgi:hypothetical protein
LKVIYSDERRIERREILSDLVYDLLFHNSSELRKFSAISGSFFNCVRAGCLRCSLYNWTSSIAAEHIKNITDRRGDRGIEGEGGHRNPGKGVERAYPGLLS